jgi:hypothetical protein
MSDLDHVSFCPTAPSDGRRPLRPLRPKPRSSPSKGSSSVCARLDAASMRGRYAGWMRGEDLVISGGGWIAGRDVRAWAHRDSELGMQLNRRGGGGRADIFSINGCSQFDRNIQFEDKRRKGSGRWRSRRFMYLRRI